MCGYHVLGRLACLTAPIQGMTPTCFSGLKDVPLAGGRGRRGGGWISRIHVGVPTRMTPRRSAEADVKAMEIAPGVIHSWRGECDAGR